MRKKLYWLIGLALALFNITACDKDLENDNDIQENFETLWSIIDQRYCFFPYKQDSIMDWDKVHTLYLVKSLQCKTTEELFYVFGDMLNELKDGHVNLISKFDVSRYDLQGNRPDNFVSNTIKSDNYLGKDYRKAGGLLYKILPQDSIGYIYYSSFSNSISEAYINNVLQHMKKCKGLIIDVRDNGGGMVTNVDLLASHFNDSKRLVGYYQRKTGPAHDALSNPQEIYLSAGSGVTFTDKPIAVLTNRNVFSAANQFVEVMKALPNVTIIGDKTGGGTGMPTSDELPCGWMIRYSSAIYLDKDMNCTEWGIEPDIEVSLDMQKACLENIDTIIEAAREDILKKAKD